MTGAPRKGWCPGALRPMMARDGLIVRVRPRGGILAAATARALADAAERRGNGRIELTARCNLQLRGLTERTLPEMQAVLRDLDLIDANAAGEAVRNVIASPLAGLGAGPDIRPLVAALEARLATDTVLHALPTKFGFLVDDGGAPSLAGIEADVRFTWISAENRYQIGLGGTDATALVIGSCEADDLVPRAVAIAGGAVRLFARLECRRMRGLLDTVGPETVAMACGGTVVRRTAECGTNARSDVVGRRTFGGMPTLGLAAPFGALDAAMLRCVAVVAARTDLGELRLTPWRTILIPTFEGPTPVIPGFIVDDDDPLLGAAACVGHEGCERGTTVTRADAILLAAMLPTGASLHVSGCAKGCAKASPSTFTLVGRDGRYDLVRGGRAGDAAERRGLDLAQIRDALAPVPA